MGRWISRCATAVLAASTVIGFLLAFHYRRDPDRGAGPFPSDGDWVEWGRLIVLTYQTLLITGAILTATWLVVVGIRWHRSSGAPLGRAVFWSATAVLWAVVALATWRMVEYDDIWLIPVPNWTAFDGFVRPAFSDQVAAFNVAGMKIERRTWAVIAATHLFANPLALGALLMSRRRDSAADS